MAPFRCANHYFTAGVTRCGGGGGYNGDAAGMPLKPGDAAVKGSVDDGRRGRRGGAGDGNRAATPSVAAALR